MRINQKIIKIIKINEQATPACRPCRSRARHHDKAGSCGQCRHSAAVKRRLDLRALHALRRDKHPEEQHTRSHEHSIAPISLHAPMVEQRERVVAAVRVVGWVEGGGHALSHWLRLLPNGLFLPSFFSSQSRVIRRTPPCLATPAPEPHARIPTGP